MTVDAKLAQTCANTIRFLAADAVERAKSGHPGMPMGMADAAFVLWTRFLRFDPVAPEWPDRDRFVLSAGHGSALLYSLLHLAGYDVTLEDLKRFRQLDSRTAGHPEFGLAPGIEVTTGPLGQGFANGVGLALARRMLAARFNAPGRELFTYRVYAIVSDGDLMEGVSQEAASLAGHLALGEIVYLYDDNRISIEGSTDLAFSEDVAARFRALGWHTAECDGHDHADVARAIEEARGCTDRPSLVVTRTRIGCGAPKKEGTAKSHGEPLGDEELAGAKKKLGWPEDAHFHVPEEARAPFAARAASGRAEREAWEATVAKLEAKVAKTLEAMLARAVPESLEAELLAAGAQEKPAATRALGGKVLQRAAALVPGLVGGSADLAPSTKTIVEASGHVNRGAFEGGNLHFGVREHAMGGVLNGLARSGAFIPYGATFLVFADYMRPSIRLASLMKQQVIYIFTHDSIFVGEDGPTHQPVEQVASLRAIPGLSVIRPADGSECAYAWCAVLRRADGPTALVLTRQNVPVLDRTKLAPAEGLLRGGYVLADCDGEPELVLIASGSEVGLALEAAGEMTARSRRVRVVSLPAWDLFAAQDAAYRASVLSPCPRRVSIEAGSTFGWERWTGGEGLAIGLDRFGESAPYEALAERFGFTREGVLARVRGRWPELF